MSDDELDVLERRVEKKWLTAAAVQMPEWSPPDNPFDMTAWTDIAPLPIGTPQFPREQWASYPTKRTVVLLLCEKMLDADEITHEQWTTLRFLMQYGGKTRLS